MSLVKDAPYHDLCYKVIGAAMDVHNELGPGHKESFYQRALSRRLQELEIACVEEQPVVISFQGVELGLLYLDHLIEDAVIVEEEAFSHMLTDEETAQVITYLAATGKPVGLLFNFGRKRLEYKRIFPPKKLAGWEKRIQRYLWKPKK
jgi:GxxExxY protein